MSFRRLIGKGAKSGNKARYKPTFFTRLSNALDFEASSWSTANCAAARARSGGGGSPLMGLPLVKVAPLFGRLADIPSG